MDTLLWQSCILVLLPMVPAIVMFKAFPSTGEGMGRFAGWEWKFGGAFAAYLIVFFLLWAAVSQHLERKEAEVWTVRGVVDAQVPNIANLISVRSVPQTLTVEADGSYEFKIIVAHLGDEPEFPRIIVDLTQICGGVRHFRLDRNPGTFPVLRSKVASNVRHDGKRRTIEIDPISPERKC
jgi:hypothetical protein